MVAPRCPQRDGFQTTSLNGWRLKRNWGVNPARERVLFVSFVPVRPSDSVAGLSTLIAPGIDTLAVRWRAPRAARA